MRTVQRESPKAPASNKRLSDLRQRTQQPRPPSFAPDNLTLPSSEAIAPAKEELSCASDKQLSSQQETPESKTQHHVSSFDSSEEYHDVKQGTRTEPSTDSKPSPRSKRQTDSKFSPHFREQVDSEPSSSSMHHTHLTGQQTKAWQLRKHHQSKAQPTDYASSASMVNTPESTALYGMKELVETPPVPGQLSDLTPLSPSIFTPDEQILSTKGKQHSPIRAALPPQHTTVDRPRLGSVPQTTLRRRSVRQTSDHTEVREALDIQKECNELVLTTRKDKEKSDKKPDPAP